MRTLFGFIGIPAGLLLGLYCLALYGLAAIEGGDLLLPLLPVEPENAATVLGVGGLVGLLASMLAIKAWNLARILLFLWWLTVTLLLAATVFRGDYRFDGMEDLTLHGWMLLGALVLTLSSWVRLRTRPER